MNSKVPEREIPEDLEEIIAKEELRKVKHGCPFFLRLWAVQSTAAENLLQDCCCQAILRNAQAGPVAAPMWSLIIKPLFLHLKNRHRTRC